METKTILHIIRNPYEFSYDRRREAELAACDLIEKYEKEKTPDHYSLYVPDAITESVMEKANNNLEVLNKLKNGKATIYDKIKPIFEFSKSYGDLCVFCGEPSITKIIDERKPIFGKCENHLHYIF